MKARVPGRRPVLRGVLCAFFALLLTAESAGAAVPAMGTSASAAILLDAESGRVLYSQNSDAPMRIASITKIMTAVVALEHCALDRKYTVTAEDMAEGSSMYLKPGETVTMEELLYGLMLASGNDAALAAARCAAGSVERFVAMMNEKAAELGLENTSFANPNGLDAEDHYSSAADMARLTAYALKNQRFREIVSTRSITIGERVLTNHNKLLSRYEGCIGVKTGFTKAAGRTLVSAAEREGQTLVAVTLNDGNDWADHQQLLDLGFRVYPTTVVLERGTRIGSAKVKQGEAASVPLEAGGDIAYPLTAGEVPELRYTFWEEVAAPVPAGGVVGYAAAYLEGKEIGRVPIICAAQVGLKK